MALIKVLAACLLAAVCSAHYDPEYEYHARCAYGHGGYGGGLGYSLGVSQPAYSAGSKGYVASAPVSEYSSSGYSSGGYSSGGYSNSAYSSGGYSGNGYSSGGYASAKPIVSSYAVKPAVSYAAPAYVAPAVAAYKAPVLSSYSAGSLASGYSSGSLASGYSAAGKSISSYYKAPAKYSSVINVAAAVPTITTGLVASAVPAIQIHSSSLNSGYQAGYSSQAGYSQSGGYSAYAKIPAVAAVQPAAYVAPALTKVTAAPIVASYAPAPVVASYSSAPAVSSASYSSDSSYSSGASSAYSSEGSYSSGGYSSGGYSSGPALAAISAPVFSTYKATPAVVSSYSAAKESSSGYSAAKESSSGYSAAKESSLGYSAGYSAAPSYSSGSAYSTSSLNSAPALAVAAPVRYAPAVPALTSYAAPAAKVVAAPVAVGKNVHKEYVDNYDLHPRYAFEYGVDDPHTGDKKHQYEERDGDVVRGEYSLVEPDGSVRTVNYVADWETGFHATVNRKDHSAAAEVARPKLSKA